MLRRSSNPDPWPLVIGFVWVAVASAVVTLIAAPKVRAHMLKQGVLDVPNHRSSHQVPIPRGGGIACALGTVTGALFATAAGHPISWAAVFAGLALALVGYLDDQRQLPVLPRLAAQVFVGAAVGLILGGVAWAGMGGILLPLIVNVVNFMDGINGITALTMSVWGVMAMLAGRADGALELATLGALIAGAALGFLPWNAPRARVFLGDVGSYLFGGLVAAGMLVGATSGVSPLLLAAPLGVYLADVGLALLKRLVRGAPLFEAHREHVYQRLTNDVGLPHMTVAASAAALAGLMAWVAGVAAPGVALVLVAALAGAYLVSAILVQRLRPQTGSACNSDLTASRMPMGES